MFFLSTNSLVNIRVTFFLLETGHSPLFGRSSLFCQIWISARNPLISFEIDLDMIAKRFNRIVNDLIVVRKRLVLRNEIWKKSRCDIGDFDDHQNGECEVERTFRKAIHDIPPYVFDTNKNLPST